MATYMLHNEEYAAEKIKPFVLVARRRKDSEIVAALPLKRVWKVDQKLPFRSVEFLVATEVDLPPLLGAPEHQMPAAAAILQRLSLSLGRAASVQLIRQPLDSALFRARHAARTPWSTVLDDPGMPISAIRTNYPDINAYFRALNKKMRSNVSRLARNLGERGRLEYLTSADPAVTPDLFRVYLDVEARSWKRGTDASLRRHPKRVQMYQELQARATAVEYHVDALLLDDIAIAAQVSMYYGRTMFAMETCYDERFAAAGPGNLMLFLAVARAIRFGSPEMSLHGHFEYYKHRWLGETIETRDIRILRKGSIPHLRAATGRLVRHLRGSKERTPGVPIGQPELSRCGLAAPPRGCHQTVASVRKHPGVTRLDRAAIEAMLPFPLSAQ